VRGKGDLALRIEVPFGEPPKPAREPRALPSSKSEKTKCRMSILTIRHPALQSMCSKD
jgi:hypothetical protein